MIYEVTVEGSFVTEMKIEANSEKDAEVKAKQQLDKIIGLSQEDYAIDLICAGEVE